MYEGMCIFIFCLMSVNLSILTHICAYMHTVYIRYDVINQSKKCTFSISFPLKLKWIQTCNGITLIKIYEFRGGEAAHWQICQTNRWQISDLVLPLWLSHLQQTDHLKPCRTRQRPHPAPAESVHTLYECVPSACRWTVEISLDCFSTAVNDRLTWLMQSVNTSDCFPRCHN